LHILIRLYDLYSTWIRILALQHMWCRYASLHPYLELHISLIRSRVKKGKLMPWWGLYTLSDLRESFDELGKVIFWKKYISKNPSYLDRRSGGDFDQDRSSHQPPKVTW
jgi:hypothetical protein